MVDQVEQAVAGPMRDSQRRPGSLSPLFQPKSIAVVGASNSAGKAGNALVRALEGFSGPLYLVNPRGGSVEGRACAPSVGEIGEQVDLAVLAIPAEAVPEALEGCGRSGVLAAIVCAGGFAETSRGALLQEEAAVLARAHGLRLLGPNTSGYLNPLDGVFATFVASATGVRPGSLAIVARSGGVNLATCFLADAQGFGVRLGVGLGNAVDIDHAEVLDFLAEDGATAAVGLHLEGIEAGRRLCEAVARLCEAKPVVALKVGAADVNDFARSHTGVLLGDYGLTRAALRQAGAVVVDDLVELVDALGGLARRRIPAKDRPGVAVVTAQAGPGLIAADTLVSSGIELPELEAPTLERLGELLPPLTWTRNPVDTGRPTPRFGELLAAVAADPGVDAMLVYALDEPDALDPAEAFESSGITALLPVIFATAGPERAIAGLRRSLGELGVPVFDEPRRAARALRAFAEDARGRWRRAEAAPLRRRSPVVGISASLGEDEALSVLEAAGIATVERRACDTLEEALAAFDAFGPPVVVKVLNREILHKSDVGGVHLGVASEAELRRAVGSIDGIPAATRSRYLVARQAPPGAELLVGAVRDPSYGPVVLLGLGGVDAELVDQTVARLAPLSAVDAAEMAEALPEALRRGHRGAPGVSLDAVAELLLALSALIVDSPEINEADLNPVRATPTGLVVLDAIILCGDSA